MDTNAANTPMSNNHIEDIRQSYNQGLNKALMGRLGAGIDIIALPMLLWLYGPVNFGYYATALAGLKLGSSLCLIGQDLALQRFSASRYQAYQKALFLRAAGYSLGVSGTVGTITVFLVSILWNEPARPLIICTAIALPMVTFLELQTAAMRAQTRFGRDIFYRQLAEPALRLVLASLLALIHTGPLSLGLALMIAPQAIICLAQAQMYKDFQYDKALPADLRADLLRTSLALLPAITARRAISEAPVIVLGMVSGPLSAGLFALARKLTSLVQMLSAASDHVVAPLSAGLSLKDQQVLGLQAVFRGLLWGPPLATALACYGPGILNFLDPSYGLGAWVVIALALWRLSELLLGPTLMLTMMGAPLRSSIKLSGLGFLLLALGLSTIFLWGLGGAVLACALATLVPQGIALARLPYRLHTRALIKPAAWAVCVSLVIALPALVGWV